MVNLLVQLFVVKDALDKFKRPATPPYLILDKEAKTWAQTDKRKVWKCSCIKSYKLQNRDMI